MLKFSLSLLHQKTTNMKPLKQQIEELGEVGFYDPKLISLRREENELFNKVAKYLTKEIQKQGGLVESSYIHYFYNKIWSGDMTFNQLKNKFKSHPAH